MYDHLRFQMMASDLRFFRQFLQQPFGQYFLICFQAGNRQPLQGFCLIRILILQLHQQDIRNGSGNHTVLYGTHQFTHRIDDDLHLCASVLRGQVDSCFEIRQSLFHTALHLSPEDPSCPVGRVQRSALQRFLKLFFQSRNLCLQY